MNRVNRFFQLKIVQVHHGHYDHIGLLKVEVQCQNEPFRYKDRLEKFVLPIEAFIIRIGSDIGDFVR